MTASKTHTAIFMRNVVRVMGILLVSSSPATRSASVQRAPSKPSPGRTAPNGSTLFSQGQQGAGVTARVAAPQHVVVANFLASPRELAARVVNQRMRPEERAGQALQQADPRVEPNDMGAFVDQDVAQRVARESTRPVPRAIRPTAATGRPRRAHEPWAK